MVQCQIVLKKLEVIEQNIRNLIWKVMALGTFCTPHYSIMDRFEARLAQKLNFNSGIYDDLFFKLFI